MTRNEILVEAIMALAVDDGPGQQASARRAIETLVQSADEHALIWAENYGFGVAPLGADGASIVRECLEEIDLLIEVALRISEAMKSRL